MPPKGKKTAIREPAVKETPVIFRLKVSETDEIDSEIIEQKVQSVVPIGASNSISYSDILTSVEESRISERFNTTILKSILEKVVIENYSEHTACFWCCHGFNWIPSFLPISYDLYKNLYICEGHFCSPECSLAYLYADNKISDSVRWNRHALLRHMYRELYMEKELSPAPARAILRMFGGQLNIAQFREYITGSNDIVLCDLPPIRLLLPTMNVQGPLRDMKKYVSLSSDAMEKASEYLRLKRSKTTNVTVPTLDMFLQKK
jgi:hypothetical protein